MTEMRNQTPPYTMVAAKVSRESSSKKDENTAVAIVPRKDKIIASFQQTRSATLELAKNTQDKTLEFAKNTQDNTVALVKNPHFQVVTVSTAGGSVSLAAVGGAFGCMGGVVVGGMVGTIPALLTFGTSIPFGAVVGGALGAPTGACVGGIAGGVAGGLAGHGAYVWRAEIKGGVLRIRVVTTQKVEQVRLALTAATDSTRSFAKDRTTKARAFAAQKGNQASEAALATKRRSYEVVTDKRFQVTAASAAGGAVVCGTTGGAVGTVAGAGTGALVGLPAAIFTFGLSIPVCATIGGGIGCVTGATAGGTAGGVAGGAAGYNAHKYRNEIAGGAQSTWSKVRSGTNKLKVKAADSVAHARAMVSGTGGTTGGAGSE